MTKFCDACRQDRPRRQFDLADGQVSATCRGCTERPSVPALRPSTPALRPSARTQRNEQLAALERQRRPHIAALVKLDAEIAELRGRPVTTSSSFARVEPSDIFDADTDVGFGD